MLVPVLFFDDGGVMNDNSRRGPQSQWLVGEFFPPLLGGAPEAWAEANGVVAPRLWEEYRRVMGGRCDADYLAYTRVERLAWLSEMCALVGVPVPGEEACLELARQATAYVTRRVCAAFPGVVAALRELHAQGHPLHTASGEHSEDLAGYLEGMGVRACFGRLYGPDLVNTPKEGPRYYRRIFADAEVEPGDALVIDDNPRALRWAAEAGARTVRVGLAGAEGGASDHVIGSLAELPGVVAALCAREA
jgi:HAD superfamily hydrolase (TIGR01509 family)